ncbi:hypothetical protein QNE54_001999 [Vibrio fluvialis]|nr:hypothetical protein [Vibrio fluvialis]MBY7795315.1 hypothetical protein [Vibrio fluvialis]
MRINFTNATKAILAGRAGYQCSHPDCDMITIGPGDRNDQISSVGEAAHIYSAAKNGPRGQDGLNEEDLKSVNNGIWMCKTHARLIDTNKGDGFSASQLISWKQLHEEAIKRKQGRIHRNIGWVSKIRIIESPVFKEDTEINLGKVTLIESNKNGAGKTAICEWLSVLGSEQSPQRWIPSRRSDTRYSINTFMPEKHEVNVSIESDIYKIDIDGVDSPFCSLPFKTFFFNSDIFKIQGRQDMKESEYLCQALDVDIVTLGKLFNKVGLSDYSFIKKVALNEDSCDLNDVDCTVKGSDFSVVLNGLSQGESNALLFELLIAKIQAYAEFSPLILFIETAETSFDNQMVSHYLDFMNSSEVSFQTVVTSLSGSIRKSSIGIAHFILHGANSNVEVSQV